MYEGFEFPQCSLARGVPFSRKVESVEEARKFGVGPSNLVSFENTEYHVLKDACMQTDPVLWAHTVSMWDNRLLPAVLEVQRVEAVIIGNARKRFTEAENRNTPLFSRLSELVKEEADLRGKVRVAIVDSSQAVPDKVTKLAEALGVFGVELPDDLVLSLPDERLLHSDAAHAAELELPHDPEESKHFLKGWVYWAVTAVTGAIFGVSALSIPGMVHPAALHKDPIGMVLFAAAAGIGFTTLAGRAMRLTFRYAAETFYFSKKKWWGSVLIATGTNLALATFYTVVDAIGLMKSSGMMAQISALSGAKASASTIDPVYILAAGAFSFTYTAYNSVAGWMEARKSAANRVTKACEDESIAAFKETRQSSGYSEAVTALNALRADRAAAGQVEEIYELAIKQIDTEREQIIANLVEPLECTDEEALMLQRARTEAEGRQAEFDELVMQLRQELLAARGDMPTDKSLLKGHRSARGTTGVGSLLKGAINRLSGIGAGAK